MARFETGALKRRTNCGGAQIAGGQCGKVALERAHGGTCCTDDNDRIIHDALRIRCAKWWLCSTMVKITQLALPTLLVPVLLVPDS